MKARIRNFSRPLSLLLVGAALLSVATQSSPAQTPKEETQAAPTSGSITGRVVTDSGQALPNATVSIRSALPFSQSRTAITDNEGNFQVNGLDPVLYFVSGASPVYISPPRDPDSQPDYYRVGDSVSVSLVKGGVITGTVQSAYGEPIIRSMVRAVMVRDANGKVPRFTGFQMARPTDDRGIYRIYGLVPGTYLVGTFNTGVFAGSMGPYDSDASTYAPSSTRDTAAEVTVMAGEEIGGVDIRYRAEPGRTVSGFVAGVEPNWSSTVTLYHLSNGVRISGGVAFQSGDGKGFAIHGLSDGDYDLVAQASMVPGNISVSEPRPVSIKGQNVTGVELTVKPLASISGRLILERSVAPECKNKRQPLFSETLLIARRNRETVPSAQPLLMSFFSSQNSPTKEGEFQIRNLAPGAYNLTARFFARYWYLRSISRDHSLTPLSRENRPAGAKRQIDLARDGLVLKFAERQSDVIFTLTEGAGSIRGKINLTAGQTISEKLYVHLVPAEKENADDVLRYFADKVDADGTFSLSNLPPGRYWAIAAVARANDSNLETAVRLPDEKELRTRLRRSAEAATNEIEIKPCQNINDYSLSRR